MIVDFFRSVQISILSYDSSAYENKNLNYKNLTQINWAIKRETEWTTCNPWNGPVSQYILFPQKFYPPR